MFVSLKTGDQGGRERSIKIHNLLCVRRVYDMLGSESSLYVGNCQPEGFVVRTVQSSPYDRLDRHVAKFVGAGYFQTEDSRRQC